VVEARHDAKPDKAAIEAVESQIPGGSRRGGPAWLDKSAAKIIYSLFAIMPPVQDWMPSLEHAPATASSQSREMDCRKYFQNSEIHYRPAPDLSPAG